MSPRILDDWIAEYLEYTAFSESPTVFHFWTAISVLGGALRRRVWIDQRYFQWTPNFYIFFVAPPGIVSKTTTASIGMRLLRRVKGIYFGPESLTWQSLIHTLAEVTEHVQMADGTLVPMSCLTIVAGELGTLFNPDDREMVDVLVDLWDSRLGPFSRGTKTTGTDVVENPWLNIIGCTTPAWISQNLPDYMIGGGFTSRAIFVYAERKRGLVAYPSDHINAAKVAYFESRLLKDLETISTIKGEYKLTPEAKAWGIDWYHTHWTLGLKTLDMETNPERYGGYIARKQTHIHKLAMILTAAKSNELVIQIEQLQHAELMITGIEKDMAKIFSNIGSTQTGRLVRELVAVVRALKVTCRSQLWRMLMSQMGRPVVFDECLRAALDAGYITTRPGTTALAEPEILPTEQAHVAAQSTS